MMLIVRICLLLAFAVGLHARAEAAQGARPAPRGAEVYTLACAACHGEDGRGVAQDRLGFDVPVPDFTDCGFASPEMAADWTAIAHDGGPVRAFDRRMPAFGEALPIEDIELAVAHVRSFCESQAWPRGELNLPRALVTEKAFPENETVFDVSIGTGSANSVSQQVIYERRIGARTQYEVVVPFEMQNAGGAWNRGLGDIAVAVKNAFFHSSEAGRILSLGGEVLLPTGKENLGLGGGVTRIEPFVAFGQILPRDGFFQFQGGVEKALTGGTPTEAFWRSALGMTLVEGRFGRSWSPIVEVVGARELEGGAPVLWDVVPQVQVSLSKRQHILFSVGVRVPANERSGRNPQVLSYFLWDWFDGGLFDGWR
jgi:hypothetical protein